MANPRIELIAQNIVSTLETITTGNGYEQTLAVYRRSRNRALTSPQNNDCVLSMIGSTQTENQPHRLAQWNQQFAVTVYACFDESDTTPSDQVLMKAASDVYKALRLDTNRGTAGSGDCLAVDTNIIGTQLESDEDGAWEAVTVIVEVLYRHDEDDPYSYPS